MIYNVQTLRALAASLVVVTHLDAMLVASGIGREHLAFGTAGVDLFFVISGFVMVYTTNGRAIAPIAFLRDRLQRIAPLYYALTLVVFVVALVAPGLLKSTTASVPDLIRSLLFIPYVKESGEIQPILFLGWTLNYEMFFYTIFALSLLLTGGIRRMMFLSLVIGLLIVAGAFVPQALTIPFFFTRPIMAEFVMGAWIGIAYCRGHRLPPALALACLLAGTFVLVGRFWLWPGGERAWWGGISSAAILIGALWLPEYRERLSQMIGGASYSLYLMHPFIIIAATRICVRLGLFDSTMGLFASAVFAFVLACVAAILSYLYVEKPVTRYFKGRTDRRHIHVEAAEA
jgi:exopolysaccharide production protein ExoZ